MRAIALIFIALANAAVAAEVQPLDIVFGSDAAAAAAAHAVTIEELSTALSTLTPHPPALLPLRELTAPIGEPGNNDFLNASAMAVDADGITYAAFGRVGRDPNGASTATIDYARSDGGVLVAKEIARADVGANIRLLPSQHGVELIYARDDDLWRVRISDGDSAPERLHAHPWFFFDAVTAPSGDTVFAWAARDGKIYKRVCHGDACSDSTLPAVAGVQLSHPALFAERRGEPLVFARGQNEVLDDSLLVGRSSRWRKIRDGFSPVAQLSADERGPILVDGGGLTSAFDVLVFDTEGNVVKSGAIEVPSGPWGDGHGVPTQQDTIVLTVAADRLWALRLRDGGAAILGTHRWLPKIDVRRIGSRVVIAGVTDDRPQREAILAEFDFASSIPWQRPRDLLWKVAAAGRPLTPQTLRFLGFDLRDRAHRLERDRHISDALQMLLMDTKNQLIGDMAGDEEIARICKRNPKEPFCVARSEQRSEMECTAAAYLRYSGRCTAFLRHKFDRDCKDRNDEYCRNEAILFGNPSDPFLRRALSSIVVPQDRKSKRFRSSFRAKAIEENLDWNAPVAGESFERIAPLLRDDDPRVKVAALGSLARLDAVRTAPLAIGLLTDYSGYFTAKPTDVMSATIVSDFATHAIGRAIRDEVTPSICRSRVTDPTDQLTRAVNRQYWYTEHAAAHRLEEFGNEWNRVAEALGVDVTAAQDIVMHHPDELPNRVDIKLDVDRDVMVYGATEPVEITISALNLSGRNVMLYPPAHQLDLYFGGEKMRPRNFDAMWLPRMPGASAGMYPATVTLDLQKRFDLSKPGVYRLVYHYDPPAGGVPAGPPRFWDGREYVSDIVFRIQPEPLTTERDRYRLSRCQVWPSHP